METIEEFKIMGMRAKRLRNANNLSIEKLGKIAGVNKSTVVRFESGIPTQTNTIIKICKVLGVSPFELISNKLIEGKDFTKTKREERILITKKKKSNIDNEESIEEPLEKKLPGGELNAYLFEFDRETKWRSHPGEEFFYCLEGKVKVHIVDSEIILEKGDSISFWAEEMHKYSNQNKDGKSVGLSVWTDKETIATKDRYPIYKEKE